MINRVEIVIAALDKASAVMIRISAHMDELEAKQSKLSKAWDRLQKAGGLEKAGGALSSIGGNLKAIAGLGNAAAGVFSNAVNAVDDFGDSMANAGIKGKQLVEFSALRDYLGQFGVSSEDSSEAMLELASNMSSAVAGSKEAREAFAATGISMADLKSKTPVDVLMKMMEVFSQSDKSGAKLKVLQALAGKSSVKMAEGLSQGVEKFEEYKQRAKAALLTEKDFEDAGNVADSMSRITGLIGRAAQKMAAVAAPKLQAFLDRSEAGLLELIPKLVDWMDRFVNSIDEDKVMGFFEGVGDVVTGVVSALRWLSDNTSVTTRVVMLLGVAFAPTLAALFSIGTVALPLLAVGWEALCAIGQVNPFALAIAAIAAGVYLIYENWDGIVDYFSAMWNRIKAVFEVNFFDGLIQLHLESWQALGNGIIGVIKSIPLIRDLDIVKNMPQLDFATKRAAAVTKRGEAIASPFAAPATTAGRTAMVSQLDFAGKHAEAMSGMGAVRADAPSSMRSLSQGAAQGFSNGPSATQAIKDGGGKTEVGGRIQLEILGAPTKVRQLSSTNNAVPIEVSAGLYGLGY